jgi:SNF2 family DNA or RNA helicase
MTSEQEQAYLTMAEDLVARLENKLTGQVVEAEAVNALAQIMKLRQITSGFLINREGEEVSIPDNPKTRELESFMEELGDKKCVVAAQFSREIDALVTSFKHLGAKKIDGHVAAQNRKPIIDEFQHGSSCNMIVLQPQAAAHGITLTAASYLVFVSLDYNFEYYYQVAKRIERLGQKNPIFIYHMVARFSNGDPTIDEDLMSILQYKSEDRTALFGGDRQLPPAEVAQRLMNSLSKLVKEKA